MCTCLYMHGAVYVYAYMHAYIHNPNEGTAAKLPVPQKIWNALKDCTTHYQCVCLYAHIYLYMSFQNGRFLHNDTGRHNTHTQGSKEDKSQKKSNCSQT
jgi:hypothetical protein